MLDLITEAIPNLSNIFDQKSDDLWTAAAATAGAASDAARATLPGNVIHSGSTSSLPDHPALQQQSSHATCITRDERG